MKRRYFASMIRRHRFDTDEPEYAQLPNLVANGDWVLDVGANVGTYTLRLSELVGAAGRVISFEPVPKTFELLAANAAMSSENNITLINGAASDTSCVVGMEIPKFDTGLDNFYMARLSGQPSDLQVLCLTIDSLSLPRAIRLVKIDAEGHELAVLRGMSGILRKDKPTLIVEDNSEAVPGYLSEFGYSSTKIEGSSNRVFCHGALASTNT